jgi:hypothetical protein
MVVHFCHTNYIGGINRKIMAQDGLEKMVRPCVKITIAIKRLGT